MLIDYAMIISKHASERISERFYNLIDVDFLESKLVDAPEDVFDKLTCMCGKDTGLFIMADYDKQTAKLDSPSK